MLVAVSEIIFELRFGNARQSLATRFYRGVHPMGFDVAQHGRLDAAVGEVKARTIVVGIDGTAIGTAAAVSVFDLCRRELHGMGIAMRGEAVDDGAAWITETKEFGDFVEGFAGGIVARVADVLVSPGVGFLSGEVEMSVASGDDEGEYGKLQFVVALLTLFEEHGVNVAFEMVDGDQRLFKGKRHGLRVADADQQGPREAGSLGDGDGID